MFDRFYRTDQSRARQTGGTGLGLAIAKWIVDRHGGWFEVVSREDVGTRITFVLPPGGDGMSWWVYLLRCGDGTLYTGITDDLDRRLAAHNAGRGAKYTRSRRPVTLVWREEQPDKSAALRREYAVKQLTRAKKLALIEGGAACVDGVLRPSLLMALKPRMSVQLPMNLLICQNSKVKVSLWKNTIILVNGAALTRNILFSRLDLSKDPAPSEWKGGVSFLFSSSASA